MKEINTVLNGEEWNGQTLYIDEKNSRLVGFSNYHQCCEHDDSGVWSPVAGFDFDSAEFATPFSEVATPDEGMEALFKIRNQDDLDEGGTVSFRLVDKDGNEGYLILVNAHNGYYSHEYVVKQDDVVVAKDYI